MDSRDHQLAALAALAMTLQILEAALPSLIPGLKPGLANVVTLITLLSLGWRAAVTVTLLRIIGASLLLGSLLSPGFWLSLAGGLTSLLMLGLMYPLFPRMVSALGLAIAAALAHTTGQFILAWTIIIPHPALIWLLPPLLLIALLAGIMTGFLTQSIITDPRIQPYVQQSHQRQP